MLRDLDVDVPIVDADVVASFWVDGEHVVCRHALDLIRRLSWRERLEVGWLLIRALSPRFEGSFDQWIRAAVGPRSRVYQVAQAFSEFALSLPLSAVSYREIRAVLITTGREGLPGVPRGGCRGVIEALVEAVRSGGGEVLVEHEVMAIARQDHRVTGVQVRDRRDGRVDVIEAPLVVSNLGPKETLALCGKPAGGPAPPPASGLKIQFLSPTSMISHRGIMFCLGTERVAGIVQPSNADPGLAPLGQHLLMSHQVLQSGDHRAEREAGLRDLRRIFGTAFDRCTVLSASRFADSWPVNRAAQGADVRGPAPLAGLHWVGDAYKPPGLMMVEGVAESVRTLPIGPRTG
jgi:phytoene dehydrogenase-like protein